jgi:hypothetical protein
MDMRLIKRNQYGRVISILAVGVISLILSPSHGMAFTACTMTAAQVCDPVFNTNYNNGSDCDGDGISDKDECEGFTTVGPNPIAVDGWNSTNAAAPFKLDPTKPDLFYALTDDKLNEIEKMPPIPPATTGCGSLILTALPNVLNIYANGLKVLTHRISLTASGDGRVLSSTSKAKLAWIKENPSTTAEGTYLGSTPESVPSDVNVSTTIYSQKIKNNVYANCAADGKCSVLGTNPLLTNRDDIVKYYILQVISHEMGHGSLLGGNPASAASYYHYSKSGTVMDPSVTFSKGVYTIPTTYDPTKDPAAAKLVK